MNDLFIPYELAVIAKQRGFNEPCFKYYDDDKDFVNLQFGFECNNTSLLDLEGNNISAPLKIQVINWLRDKHYIKIIETEKDFCEPAYYLVKLAKPLKINRISKTTPTTLNKAITVALKLI